MAKRYKKRSTRRGPTYTKRKSSNGGSGVVKKIAGAVGSTAYGGIRTLGMQGLAKLTKGNKNTDLIYEGIVGGVSLVGSFIPGMPGKKAMSGIASIELSNLGESLTYRALNKLQNSGATNSNEAW